jgi:hypothetical protein
MYLVHACMCNNALGSVYSKILFCCFVGKDIGCDKQAVISIVCHRNQEQRSKIRHVYELKYEENFLKRLRSELHGHFEVSCQFTFVFYCHIVNALFTKYFVLVMDRISSHDCRKNLTRNSVIFWWNYVRFPSIYRYFQPTTLKHL